MIDGIEGKWLPPELDEGSRMISDSEKLQLLTHRVSELEYQLEVVKNATRLGMNYFDRQDIDDLKPLINNGLQECL